MKFIALACALALSGCATTGLTTVKVPVSAPCKTVAPTPPVYQYAPPYDNVFNAVRDLLGDRQASIAYEIELFAALKSCQ